MSREERLMNKVERLSKLIEEKDEHFIQMCELLLGRIGFIEDIEGDKSNWIKELEEENTELRNKIYEIRTYMENYIEVEDGNEPVKCEFEEIVKKLRGEEDAQN